jgi:hypothetical protein
MPRRSAAEALARSGKFRRLGMEYQIRKKHELGWGASIECGLLEVRQSQSAEARFLNRNSFGYSRT